MVIERKSERDVRARPWIWSMVSRTQVCGKQRRVHHDPRSFDGSLRLKVKAVVPIRQKGTFCLDPHRLEREEEHWEVDDISAQHQIRLLVPSLPLRSLTLEPSPPLTRSQNTRDRTLPSLHSSLLSLSKDAYGCFLQPPHQIGKRKKWQKSWSPCIRSFPLQESPTFLSLPLRRACYILLPSSLRWLSSLKLW